ncbi:MAG: hypothetical protein H8D45_30950 [Bacteroidetes bacterium]|nr:hypothetical protein [Bacteroidota bacterium]
MEEIYKLDLHHSTDTCKFDVTRVPGGWIYCPIESHAELNPQKSRVVNRSAGIFVPYVLLRTEKERDENQGKLGYGP